jgi:hypothetical protein
VSLTPEQRSTRARIAALTRWAAEDPKANGERGQAGLQRKFYNQTDPSLPEAERQRRAHAAYRAHMARLSFQRSKRTPRPVDAGGDAA